METKKCKLCSDVITEVRANKNYCTNACKQKAYRLNLMGVSDLSYQNTKTTVEKPMFGLKIRNRKKSSNRNTAKAVFEQGQSNAAINRNALADYSHRRVILNQSVTKMAYLNENAFSPIDENEFLQNDSAQQVIRYHTIISLSDFPNKNKAFVTNTTHAIKYLPISDTTFPLSATDNALESEIIRNAFAESVTDFVTDKLIKSVTNHNEIEEDVTNNDAKSVTNRNDFVDSVTDNSEKSVTYRNEIEEDVTNNDAGSATNRNDFMDSVTDNSVKSVTNRNEIFESVTDNVVDNALNDKSVTDSVTDYILKSESVTDFVTDNALNDKSVTDSVTDYALKSESVTNNITDSIEKSESIIQNVTDNALNDKSVTDSVTDYILKSDSVTDNVTDTFNIDELIAKIFAEKAAYDAKSNENVSDKFKLDDSFNQFIMDTLMDTENDEEKEYSSVTDYAIADENDISGNAKITVTDIANIETVNQKVIDKANTIQELHSDKYVLKEGKVDIEIAKTNSLKYHPHKNKDLKFWLTKNSNIQREKIKKELSERLKYYHKLDTYSKSVTDFVTELIQKRVTYLLSRVINPPLLKKIEQEEILGNVLTNIEPIEIFETQKSESEIEIETKTDNIEAAPIIPTTNKPVNPYCVTESPMVHFSFNDTLSHKMIYNASSVLKSDDTQLKSYTIALKKSNSEASTIFKSLDIDLNKSQVTSDAYSVKSNLPINEKLGSSHFSVTENSNDKSTKASIYELENPRDYATNPFDFYDNKTNSLQSLPVENAIIQENNPANAIYNPIRCEWMDDIYINADERAYKIKNHLREDDSKISDGTDTIIYKAYFEILHQVLDLNEKSRIRTIKLVDITNLLTRLITSEYFESLYDDCFYFNEMIHLRNRFKKICLNNINKEELRLQLVSKDKRALIAQLYELSQSFKREKFADLEFEFEQLGM
jgi:hypothetical protein